VIGIDDPAQAAELPRWAVVRLVLFSVNQGSLELTLFTKPVLLMHQSLFPKTCSFGSKQRSRSISSCVVVSLPLMLFRRGLSIFDDVRCKRWRCIYSAAGKILRRELRERAKLELRMNSGHKTKL
jgi:hypothetical protein